MRTSLIHLPYHTSSTLNVNQYLSNPLNSVANNQNNFSTKSILIVQPDLTTTANIQIIRFFTKPIAMFQLD